MKQKAEIVKGTSRKSTIVVPEVQHKKLVSLAVDSYRSMRGQIAYLIDKEYAKVFEEEKE